ncbi:hypothetical protein WJ27_00125 [Burkholderia thailandensis]|nr:hypothetical protein WJ27_00125 [Burkholderia thailandensis]
MKARTAPRCLIIFGTHTEQSCLDTGELTVVLVRLVDYLDLIARSREALGKLMPSIEKDSVAGIVSVDTCPHLLISDIDR